MTQVDPILLDRVYEAAILPDRWLDLVDSVSREVRGAGGLLFTTTSVGSTQVISPNLQPIVAEIVRRGWDRSNPRLDRLVKRGLFGFTITDQDLLTDAEIAVDPLYEFLRERGVGWGMAFTIQVPSGENLVFNLERAYAIGPFDRKDVMFVEALRPHISRAALLTARLGMERARAAAQAMGLIGLPTGVLSNKLRLMTTNPLFERYMPDVLFDGRDRLHLRDARADGLLVNAMDSLKKDMASGAPLSIPVAANGEQSAIVLHLVPVRRAANDIFSGASCLAVVTPLDRKKVPSAILIQGLFDLTGAEARVARLIGAGNSINEIAAQNGVGVGTVRNQVKAIFSKTGLSRQADLVAMIGNITLLRSVADERENRPLQGKLHNDER